MRIKRFPLAAVGMLVLVLGVVVWVGYTHFALGYGWARITGLGEFTTSKTTTEKKTADGSTTTTETIITETQPAKTLWDLMGLLLVPLILVLAGHWLSGLQKEREEQRLKQAEMTEESRVQEARIKSYLDYMTVLLLEKHLRTSDPEAELRSIARSRTLTVLQRLDGAGKGSILLFLYESGLIGKDPSESIIGLRNADLSAADLRGMYLRNANLREANLNGADLTEANMRGTILTEARLVGANLTRANMRDAVLKDADLTKATLTKANLRLADLSGAVLKEATMRDTVLHDAELREAKLTRADLTGADLLGIDPKKIQASPEQLSVAKSVGQDSFASRFSKRPDKMKDAADEVQAETD